MENHMIVTFDAISENESFARVAVSAFLTTLNPTIDELSDVKTAVSEAVTNAVIHGYDGRGGNVTMSCTLDGRTLQVTVKDAGRGIADVHKARTPFYTTRPELERSGMGFAFMEAFMDSVKVESEVGLGTRVSMEKTFLPQEE